MDKDRTIKLEDLMADIQREEARDFEETPLRLRDCVKPHDFVVSKRFNYQPAQYRCTKCGGIVSALAAEWYKLGLAHTKNP